MAEIYRLPRSLPADLFEEARRQRLRLVIEECERATAACKTATESARAMLEEYEK